LFSTQLIHEYYLPRESSLYLGIPADQQQRIMDTQQNKYKVSRDFFISPTKDCRNLLDNHRLIFKQNNFGFSLACQVTGMGDGTFAPLVPLNKPFSLRFAVSLENRQMINMSNIRLEKETKNKDRFMYYFSNRADNQQGSGPLYLSRTVPDFDASYAYEAGEIVISLTDPANPVMLEAIENNGPGAFNTSKWFSIYPDLDPLPQFVTKEDRIVLRPAIFKHNVESAAKENLSFLLYNYTGEHLQTIHFTTTEPGTTLTECELRLSGFPSAYYILEVRDDTGTVIPELGLTFFMDDVLYLQRPFALIECFFEPDGSLNSYRWLDQYNENRLLSPNYTIHWKNRSTFWRYYYASAPSFASSQVEVYELTPGNPVDTILVSTQPLGLTQFSRRIEIDMGGDTFFLPNPEVASIFPDGSRIYSEINMGGGLGPPS